MTDVLFASTPADAAAAGAIEQHHAELAGALAARVAEVLTAAVRGDDSATRAARRGLDAWCHRELLPHAAAEEQTLYRAAAWHDRGRLLVDSMLGEHRTLVALVDELAAARDTVRVAAAARALQAVLGCHLAKEDQLVLPLLTEAPDVSLADLLGGMRELVGTHRGAVATGTADGPVFPELDARSVPQAIRHATVFGALDSVAPGSGLVLVAPHDPLPLLAQIEQRWGGAFTVDYLQRGPEAWRLSFTRTH